MGITLKIFATDTYKNRNIIKQAKGKASGVDGISAELFQILKDDAVKVMHSTCHQIWETKQGHRTGKGQFSLQS